MSTYTLAIHYLFVEVAYCDPSSVPVYFCCRNRLYILLSEADFEENDQSDSNSSNYWKM